MSDKTDELLSEHPEQAKQAHLPMQCCFSLARVDAKNMQKMKPAHTYVEPRFLKQETDGVNVDERANHEKVPCIACLHAIVCHRGDTGGNYDASAQF